MNPAASWLIVVCSLLLSLESSVYAINSPYLKYIPSMAIIYLINIQFIFTSNFYSLEDKIWQSHIPIGHTVQS